MYFSMEHFLRSCTSRIVHSGQRWSVIIMWYYKLELNNNTSELCIMYNINKFDVVLLILWMWRLTLCESKRQAGLDCYFLSKNTYQLKKCKIQICALKHA